MLRKKTFETLTQKKTKKKKFNKKGSKRKTKTLKNM